MAPRDFESSVSRVLLEDVQSSEKTDGANDERRYVTFGKIASNLASS